MTSDPKNILPENLLKQLERIELIGNAEAQSTRDEVMHFSILRRENEVIQKVRPSKETKFFEDDFKEAKKSINNLKNMGLLMLIMPPLFALGYIVSGFLQDTIASTLCLLAAGIMFGLGVTLVIYAKNKMKLFL